VITPHRARLLEWENDRVRGDRGMTVTRMYREFSSLRAAAVAVDDTVVSKKNIMMMKIYEFNNSKKKKKI
jgi:hypothetical protein